MISRLLVANRSEIAIRVFRSARELGLTSVAIYSFEDRYALHRFQADEAYQIGTAGEPVKGGKEHTYKWQDATWRFASAENRDRFSADPEKYAPQYGGYCAYAVSEGYTAGIDPRAWTIVDGKLYLNYSLKVKDLWSQDRAERIRKADENWPNILGASE